MGDTSFIANSGRIEGTIGEVFFGSVNNAGIFQAGSVAGSSWLENSGLISTALVAGAGEGGAGKALLFNGTSNDVVINTGTIRGDVLLGYGNDNFDSTLGTVVTYFGVRAVIHGGDGNDTIRGGLAASVIHGDSGFDILVGNVGNDLLIGGGDGSADTLDGGSGSDTMMGDTAGDTYFVDTLGDTIVDAGGADDVVKYTGAAGTTYTLPPNLEKLVLLSASNGSGNSGNNSITGNSGANVLDGKAGADAMVGMSGDDTYMVDSLFDGAAEFAGGGIDTVISSVTWTLALNFENLTLTGVASYGTGNSLANVITGNALDNALSGLSGNDVLVGGLGHDTLAGGANADAFLFNTVPAAGNVDTITDFVVPGDTIRLENAVFTKILGVGTLTTAQFWKSATGLAHDASDRVVYETDTGKLFYDSNGNAAGGRVQIAVLSNHAAITNADIFII